MISVKEFIKKLDFKPLYKVKEPKDSCGLSICQFKEKNNHHPNIEIGEDGFLYFEILDETNYKEGDFIPLKSDMRKDVINYTKIIEENEQYLADEINKRLHKLYDEKR